MDYNKTLNLPKTDFPMRGNLPKREPETLKKWEDDRLYYKMIENNKIVLMEKSSSIIDKIKESFNKDGLSEVEIIELYSNVDMLIIDDCGNENLSKWALEKLYKIISNRYDNELPIVITTRYNKEQLIEQLSTENDTEIAEEIVEVLNEMCYGTSIVEEIKAKEKVSISDQTIC